MVGAASPDQQAVPNVAANPGVAPANMFAGAPGMPRLDVVSAIRRSRHIALATPAFRQVVAARRWHRGVAILARTAAWTTRPQCYGGKLMPAHVRPPPVQSTSPATREPAPGQTVGALQPITVHPERSFAVLSAQPSDLFLARAPACHLEPKSAEAGFHPAALRRSARSHDGPPLPVRRGKPPCGPPDQSGARQAASCRWPDPPVFVATATSLAGQTTWAAASAGPLLGWHRCDPNAHPTPTASPALRSWDVQKARSKASPHRVAD